MSNIFLIVSVLFVIGLSFSMFYTSQCITYEKANPYYYPAQPSAYQPDGGFFGCKILNHTYGDALIDVFATLEANRSFTSCANNKTVRFYGEIYQSCRCHNASQVNRTVEKDFPIGQTISCCLNSDCTFFNNICDPDSGSYSYPSPRIGDYELLFVFEASCLTFAILILLATLTNIAFKKNRNRGYATL